jgi:hypothetical protein
MRVRAIAVVVILLSYGALGARQPAVRTAAPLPVSAEEVAKALGFASIDRSHFVLDVIRATFALGVPAWDARQRGRLGLLLQKSTGKPGETVPLPLDPSVWRETILRRQVQNDELIGAILSDRNAALLYHGLAALDDETLAWLGPDRDTLQHLLRHAGSFAAFGRSIRVRAGRVAVPGGKDMEPSGSRLGSDPARPGPLCAGSLVMMGRAAWFLRLAGAPRGRTVAVRAECNAAGGFAAGARESSSECSRTPVASGGRRFSPSAAGRSIPP